MLRIILCVSELLYDAFYVHNCFISFPCIRQGMEMFTAIEKVNSHYGIGSFCVVRVLVQCEHSQPP